MSAETVSAEAALDALDELLARLQHGDLSALELRILIRLAERQTNQSELADSLEARPGAINRAIRRLAMRGLIGRRFDRGPRSRFVLSITSSGLLAVTPLVECASAAQRGPQRGPLAVAAAPEGGGHVDR